MKEKTKNILLIMLAVLLAVSVALNCWLLYEKYVQNSVSEVPENYQCAFDRGSSSKECIMNCMNSCIEKLDPNADRAVPWNMRWCYTECREQGKFR